jgi:hypothetical protein
VTPFIGPIGRKLAQSPGVLAIKSRFPRAAGFLIHRFNPRDPWGLPATLAGIVMFAGLWFFLGVLQDIVAKDPLVVLDLRLHNAVPLFRTAGMTRVMLTITELGGAAVLSLLCLGTALVALAQGRRRLAATFLLALGHAQPSRPDRSGNARFLYGPATKLHVRKTRHGRAKHSTTPSHAPVANAALPRARLSPCLGRHR